jgi:predicted amidohydrolase
MTDQLAAPATPAYPADPADLFVELYDALPAELFDGWTVTGWSGDPEARRQATEISETVLDLGQLDPAVTDKIVSESGHRGRFTLLLGLDVALAHANPYGPYHDSPAMTGLLVRYLTEGRFNEATAGALLPRCAYPGRPRGRRAKDEFFGVHRVPAEHWDKVEHSVLPAVHDAYFPRDEPVAVGCAPLMETFDDVELSFEERFGMTVYRLRPADSSGLRTRIKAIMRRLDEAGAQVAVMPEASLTDALLEHWKEVAFDTAGRDRSAHPLRYLLLGSGPLGSTEPPPNRAVLLDRWTGRELLVQDKLSGFTLDEEQMRTWRLPNAPEKGVADEYISPGTTVGLLDCSLGRLAMLICEDLSRSMPWDRELRSCGVSHLFVPIFSKPILRFRWERLSAERQVTVLGSWVMVANSLVVGAAIPEEEIPEPRFTCLVAGPRGLKRTSYDMDIQFGRAEAGDELGLMETPEGLKPPRVFPGAVYNMWHDHWPPTEG